MVCVTCKKIYRPKKNGVYFEEMMPVKNGHEPNAEGWSPYKLWVGDLLACPGCGHEVIAGVPLNPVAEHYQEHYAKAVKELQPMLQVNDCGNLQMGSQHLGAIVEKEAKLREIYFKCLDVKSSLEGAVEDLNEVAGALDS